MGLDISLKAKWEGEVYNTCITHNLGKMAKECGVYEACWRPEEIRAKKAKHIIKILEKGIEELILHKGYFVQYNPTNNWGNYNDLLSFLQEYLQACKTYPKARINAYR